MADTMPVFKNAIVGGFNKEDVIAYLMQQSDDHKHDVAMLRETIDELTKASDGHCHKAEELEAEKEELEASISLIVKSSGDKISDMRAQLDENKRQLAELEHTKLHLVDMELSARKRADSVEQLANERVNELCADYRGKFARVCQEYDEFKNDADHVIEEIHRELSALNKMFDSLARGLSNSQQYFTELVHNIDVSEPPEIAIPELQIDEIAIPELQIDEDIHVCGTSPDAETEGNL